MSNKMHDLLRELQWIIPAVVAFYGVIDKVFNIGLIGTVETLAAALVTLIGVIAQHSSRTYFDTKTIVDRIVPDQDPEEIQEED